MPKQSVAQRWQCFLYWSNQVPDKILSDLQEGIHLEGALAAQIYITSQSAPLPGIFDPTHNGLSIKQGNSIILVALKSWSTEPPRSWVPIQGCGSPQKNLSVTEKAGTTPLLEWLWLCISQYKLVLPN